MNSNIFEIDKLLLFLLMFVPGFISLKVYDSIFPNPPRDFTKYWIDAIGYSAVHYAIMLCVFSITGIIDLDCLSNLSSFEKYKNLISTPLILLIWLVVIPAFYPVVYLILIKFNIPQRLFIHPIQKPWDYLFWRGQAYWVIVYLKNGGRVAGKYDKNSFASSYPDGSEIMLEEVWEINLRGEFVQPANPKRGVVLCSNEVLKIEFLSDDDTD